MTPPTGREIDAEVAELKRLCEAQITAKIEVSRYGTTDHDTYQKWRAARDELRDACSPDRMLRLIARIEQQDKALRDIAEQCIHYSELDGIDENWRQKRARQAIQELNP